MAQVINTNFASLNAQRNLNQSQSMLGVSLQRLSTGLRINSAKDDAAGLAISERMTAQIRGMDQSKRNMNDAVSMVQTSESALSEITNLFQRGRELAVQSANATNSQSDRTALQSEMSQIIAEVERISTTTEFNSVKLFGGGSTSPTYVISDSETTPLTDEQKQLIIDLKTSWLEQSEDMIEEYFGITGDGSNLEINFVEGEGYLAAVNFTGYESSSGKAVNLSLSIDLEDFLPSSGANGGPSFVSNDRIIMHELTHTVMARSVNMQDLPLWFIEGSAEFIHGADSRLNSDLAAMAGSTASEKVDNLMSTYLTNDGTSQQYSAGYAATRYLHQSIIDEGGTGIKEVFDFLEANNGSTLDDAIQSMKGTYSGLAYGTQAQLEGIFNDGEAGNTYVANLLLSGSLTDTDTGAVGGSNADGGTRITTSDAVVPDSTNLTENPLADFAETFPSYVPVRTSITLASTDSFQFQVGANVGETITIDKVSLNSGNLGIATVDLVNNPSKSIEKFDLALNAINQERARLGAIQNRLNSATTALETNIENTSSSRSRIMDTDFAIETANLTKAQILQQAGMAMITQANSLPQNILSLLQ